MVQQIKARMSKIEIGKDRIIRQNIFFFWVEIQFIGTCINHHVGKIYLSLKKQNKS